MNLSRFTYHTLFSLSAIAAASAFLSADEKERVYELEDFSVVSTRTLLPLSELSVSTSFVGADEIETRQFRSLSDVLATLPGVSVVSSGQEGAVKSLFTRGTESNHTALLINGRRLPSGFAGQYDLGQLGLDNIQSVEFVRGPSSSLYGADAIGGVVDLRSRVAEEGFSGALQSEVGDFNSRAFQSQLLYGVEDFSLSFDAGYGETDNDRANSEYDRFSLNAYTVYEIAEDFSFDFQALYYDTSLGVAGDERFAPAFYPNAEINETVAYLLSPRFTLGLTDDISVEMLYSHTSNELEATNAPFFPENRRFTQTGNELETLLRVDPEDSDYDLTLGFRYYETKFERGGIAPTVEPLFVDSYNSLSVFGQAIVDVTEQFRIIGSGRFDEYSDFDDAFTGNVELSYKIDATDTILFAKYGTGYAVPVGNDLARLSEDLEAEESRSWEVGFNQSLIEGKLDLAVIYFQTDIDNLVDDDGDFFNPSYLVVDTEQEGVEATLNIMPVEWLEISVGYTYLDAIITDGLYFGGNAGMTGARLIRRPRHQLSSNVEVDLWEQANIGAGLVAAIDREDPANTDFEDYMLVRIYGDWELIDGLTVFARVENLLDEKYQYTPGFTGSGRIAYGGVRYSF